MAAQILRYRRGKPRLDAEVPQIGSTRFSPVVRDSHAVRPPLALSRPLTLARARSLAECTPLTALGHPVDKTWVRLQCEEVEGFLGDLRVEVVMSLYGDKDCTDSSDHGPPLQRDQDACYEIHDNHDQFVEDVLYSCDGNPHAADDEGPWPVPGMSLMAAAVLFVCLFGQCQAQARARRYRPRAGAAAGRRRGLNEALYDPAQHAGYGSVARGSSSGGDSASGGGGGGGGGGRPAVVEELTPVAKQLVKEHEESGAEVPTMQQITQLVLRARSVPPAEKRHTMMLLFRHWGYAGGEKEKPPASDHPSASQGRPAEEGDAEGEEVEAEENAALAVDVEAPVEPAPPSEAAEAAAAAVAAGSAEVDSTPLLEGAE